MVFRLEKEYSVGKSKVAGKLYIEYDSYEHSIAAGVDKAVTPKRASNYGTLLFRSSTFTFNK